MLSTKKYSKIILYKCKDNIIYYFLIILFISTILYDKYSKTKYENIVIFDRKINNRIKTDLKNRLFNLKNGNRIIKDKELKYIKNIKYYKLSSRYNYIKVKIYKPIIKIISSNNIYTLLESNKIVNYNIFQKEEYLNIPFIEVDENLISKHKKELIYITKKILDLKLLNNYIIKIKNKEEIILKNNLLQNITILLDYNSINKIKKIEMVNKIYKKYIDIDNNLNYKNINFNFDIRFKNIIILKRVKK